MNNLYECIICLEDLQNDIAILSCGHNYHYKCIKNWIKSKKTLINICPLCNENTNVEILNILNDTHHLQQEQEQEQEQEEPEISLTNKFFCCNIL